ncbi:transcriptional activator NhaR [Glaciecola petra]|uniref:Transcriptional activator NhaR n=1 Tax=Glaciecola petra TaxID=3075602 RepID=A0ABU2ZQ13_9ALTE|nr:transcriptional activator NhaR [Aestuariibacter sp. P117]MDT0594500.1 transcriptional activator NhaR [Aestuariibacter sp. P117]
MSENLNYKHLHYFWVVATEGSIARAADKLFITPQTISGQLSMLEERIGQPLFDRVGRRLRLTETGRLVLRYADDIFELGRELSDVLRGAPLVGTSEFIVSAASALPKTIVYKVLEPALTISDDISLTCKEGPVEAILGELAVHEVDMVLTDTPLSSAFSIKAYNHYLGQSSLSFFASPALAAKLDDNFPLNLHDAPMLLPTKQYAIRQLFDKWCTDNNVFPTVKGQYDDSALMKSFGQSGFGIFFMPSIIEAEVKKAYGLTVIGRSQSLKQKFYAISAERKVTHPAVAAICNTARDIIFK